MKRTNQSGVALITVMLVLLLMSALLVGFTMMVMGDSRLSGIDRDYRRAFYAAQAGMEKMTADLGTLFSGNLAPTGAQINALTAAPPATLLGITFVTPAGANGYAINFPADIAGNPIAQNRTILSGPFQGFVGLVTPYSMNITAVTNTGYEVRLTRTVQTVAIPVFQFGIFSETDLSFFPGPVFNFGGRVHTNGNLFLASGNDVRFTDRITVSREAVRTHLANGVATSVAHTGLVNITTSPGTFRNLATNEASLVANLGSALNDPTWTNISIGTYNGNIRNGRTGARALTLPLSALGSTPIEMIRRGVPNEDVANPALLQLRYYQQASLRILLSDTAADILNLPGITAAPPVLLMGIAGATGIPFATSGGNCPGGAYPTPCFSQPAATPLIGGFLKIERQDFNGVWTDVTLEILNLGIEGRNLHLTAGCAEPKANAILRFQRVREDTTLCRIGSVIATDYWPMVLYDTREGNLRDNITTTQTTLFLGGVMHYVELDVRNLSRWFQGAIGATGNQAWNLNGFTVYFSDRRNNGRDPITGLETAEYGFEDFVNPLSGAGTPNGLLNTGEDLNADGLLQTYGQNPINVPLGSVAPLTAAARPNTLVNANVARVNRPILFRRALKLVNGGPGLLVAPGLTIVAENPVYIQGNYNSNGAFGVNPGVDHVACSVIGDAVTLLSTVWNDIRSFTAPHNTGGRVAATTWYRTALISGKGLAFPQPAGTGTDYGTDGGVHNFLRYIENWGGRTLNYRGSIVSFYFNRQAIGTYKCCANVYSPPTRGYNFDVEFLQPLLLPPRTPAFRDVNATGFSQVIMPTP